MELASLALVAGAYAAAAVARTIADVHVEDLYRRLLASLKKTNGREVDVASATPEDTEVSAEGGELAQEIVGASPVLRRLSFVGPKIAGSRVLWVDDHPQWNVIETRLLAHAGLDVDVAESNPSASAQLVETEYDVVISDIDRQDPRETGLQLLPELRVRGYDGRIIFYVGQYDPELGTPVGARGITNRPDELLHLVMDVLERRKI